MMRNDSDVILDDLLSRWHSYCAGERHITGGGADPMFRNVKSGRGWDTVDEIIEDEIASDTMDAITFHVSGDKRGHGAMEEPYRSAIYVHARNLASRHAVWNNPRLPADPKARAAVIAQARGELMRRLLLAGVM
jgi:hypothetical protein